MERKAKIVCTIGPASAPPRVIGGLIAAGMNVARLNFSHGTHEEHRTVFERLRRLGAGIAIMQDLAGPKIRIGEVRDGGALLREGDRFILTTRRIVGDARRARVTYERLPADVRAGDDLYLADGVIHLRVEGARGGDVRCRIVHGGLLTSRKGLNVPRLRIGSSLGEKDARDLDFGLSLGVDYVAVSFVRSATDVRHVKRIIDTRGSRALVVAKIEKREALERLDEIVEAADAIMIARGDLGVEIPLERVPVMQKEIIDACRDKGKPVIVATQMLISMVNSERPTRAEASDVANAALDGADALMLSEETAVGGHPVESVSMMERIIREAESYRRTLAEREGPRHIESPKDPIEAVCAAAVETASHVGARAIACLTHSGRTARLVSRYRPERELVVALTNSAEVVRQASLLWGTIGIRMDRITETDSIFPLVRSKLRAAGLRGRVVLTAGIPLPKKGSTNTVHIVSI